MIIRPYFLSRKMQLNSYYRLSRADFFVVCRFTCPFAEGIGVFKKPDPSDILINPSGVGINKSGDYIIFENTNCIFRVYGSAETSNQTFRVKVTKPGSSMGYVKGF